MNGEQSDTVFTTKTEDVTKAYPYLTAKGKYRQIHGMSAGVGWNYFQMDTAGD